LVKLPKKSATFNLLPYFGNYIRNPTKILVNFGTVAKITAMPKFGKIFFWHQSEQALTLLDDVHV
jgi:hypothetical protein